VGRTLFLAEDSSEQESNNEKMQAEIEILKQK